MLQRPRCHRKVPLPVHELRCTGVVRRQVESNSLGLDSASGARRTPGLHSTERSTVSTIDEALSELQREVNVRKRCYDRWVQEGRLTAVDARDRLDRIIAAIHFLESVEVVPMEASV